MNALSGSVSANAKRKKQSVGAVAVAFVILFIVLLFFKVLNIIDFLIFDLVVGLVANYIFRRLDRQTTPKK
jgi:hypothetical protein